MHDSIVSRQVHRLVKDVPNIGFRSEKAVHGVERDGAHRHDDVASWVEVVMDRVRSRGSGAGPGWAELVGFLVHRRTINHQ